MAVLALSILGLLMAEPLHGYEIRKQLSGLLGISGVISYGSLYPTLAKLHRQGLIDSQDGQVPISKRDQTEQPYYSTGSLSGDIAYGSKRSFNKNNLLPKRKNKKVYAITEKGMVGFKDKLLSSYTTHADDDRVFVAHLAFLNYATDSEKNLFIRNRIGALESRLQIIPSSDNNELQRWNTLEHDYIEKQISFLKGMEKQSADNTATN